MSEEQARAEVGSAGKAPSGWNRVIGRLSGKANLAEARFLGLLRYSALGIAAIVLLGSLLLLALGSVRQLGRTQVEPESVTVSSDDVVPPKAEPKEAAPVSQPRKPGISQDIRSRTLSIYRARFKGFQRPDTKITDQQIVDFVWSEDRIERFDALAKAALLDEEGKPLETRSAMMLNALGTVEKATQSDAFRQQLAAYRDAQKVNVCTDEVQNRTRTISSWDPYGTYCPSWYVSPVGCPSTRVVDEPVVVKTCAMKFPEHLEAPAQQFAGAIQRYAEKAETKLAQARNEAEQKTARNHARKLEGQDNISTGVKLFLGFLAIMFLYLFVAIERHHRTLRALVVRREEA